MYKKAKIINIDTKEVSVGLGTDDKFYESLGMTDMEVEQAYNGAWYINGYAPPTPLSEVKSAKISELKSERNSAEKSPITTDIGVFDFDDDSRSRITGAMEVLNGTDIEIEWTLADNTSVSVGYADLKSVIVTASVRCNMLHQKYRTLRDMVEQAETAEEVNNISWGIINNG